MPIASLRGSYLCGRGHQSLHYSCSDYRTSPGLRGDILDIFPKNGDYPIRIEFFGDSVERITYFDIETQKSIESLDRIDMYMNNNKNSQIDFYKLINLSENRIIFENREILQYKLEEIILRDREREKN